VSLGTDGDGAELEGIIHRAKWRLLVHVATAVLLIVPISAYRAGAVTTAERWTGYGLLALGIMYAGLGVAVFKESIPSLRTSRGTVLDEPAILAQARSAAGRDGLVVGSVVAATLLLLPAGTDLRAAGVAVLAFALGDFTVRQARGRRRATKGRADGSGPEGQASMR
jgi:hypothetical protein